MTIFPKKITLKDGSELILREAIEKDAAAMIEYVNEVIGETPFLTREPGEFNLTEEDEKELIKERQESPFMIFLIAEVDGEMVGLSSLDLTDRIKIRHIGTLGISVRKKFWGNGVASALMESMIEWAKATKSIRKINLTVQENNENAIALYKKFGFKEEGFISREALIEGKFYASYWMGLEID